MIFCEYFIIKQIKMKKFFCLLFCFVILNFFISGSVFAASENFDEMGMNDVLDDAIIEFQKSAEQWVEGLTNKAKVIFWMLGCISITWTFGTMALRKADVTEIFAELFKFTITIGFFYYLLTNAPVIAREIFKGSADIGSEISGFSITSILDTGTKIFINTVNKIGVLDATLSPMRSVAAVIISGIGFILLVGIALQVAILTISSWLVLYAGIFVLGFGSSPWTRDFAIAYIKKTLALGLELMTLYLLLGSWNYFADLLDGLNTAGSYSHLLFYITVVVILYQLCNKLPSMVSSLVGGGSGGAGSGGFGMLVGASSMAMGGASKLASAPAAVAKGAATVANMASIASNLGNNIKQGFSNMVGGDKSKKSGGQSVASMMGTTPSNASPKSDSKSGGGSSGGGDSGGSSGGGDSGGSSGGGDSGSSSGGGAVTNTKGSSGAIASTSASNKQADAKKEKKMSAAQKWWNDTRANAWGGKQLGLKTSSQSQQEKRDAVMEVLARASAKNAGMDFDKEMENYKK